MAGLGLTVALPMTTCVRRIGLTGGIGSGKSTVAQFLRALGAEVVDADELARAVTAPGGAAIEPLRRRFGPRAIGPDGAMDRAWMREQAFADPRARQALEAVVHPLVEQSVQARMAAADGDAVIVFDVPLLVESGRWRQRVQRVLVVDCDEAVQAARVGRRPGWTAVAAQHVMAQQATRAARRQAADAVIDNSLLDLEQLRAQVEALWHLWVAPAPPPV
jgi:dephospho-CoA kinase